MENANFLSVFTDEALIAEVTRRGLVPAVKHPTIAEQIESMGKLLGDGKVALSDLWGEVDGTAMAAFLSEVDDNDLWEAIYDKDEFGTPEHKVTAALECLRRAQIEVRCALNELER